MRLNQVPNLRVEDFSSENRSLLVNLFIQLNPFIQAVAQVFNQNIDFATNIRSVTRTYDVDDFQAFSLSWPFGDSAPMSVQIVYAIKGARNTPTVLVAPWSYDSSTRLISIPSMQEITAAGVSSASGRYQFILRASV